MSEEITHAVGLANTAVISRLLRLMLDAHALSKAQILDLLTEAVVDLQQKDTLVTSAAAGHVLSIRQAFE